VYPQPQKLSFIQPNKTTWFSETKLHTAGGGGGGGDFEVYTQDF